MTPAFPLRFSLVVATLGRVVELDALLMSLAQQVGPDFEIIVIDQNNDDRLDALLARHGETMSIRHVRSDIRMLSHARNLGLRLCRGEIIGFPDDDCLYPPGVPSTVAAVFADNPDLGLFSGAMATPEGGLGSGRWHPVPATITRANVWITAMSSALFLRRAVLDRIGGFDERLGVGAVYGSGEETDLVVRAIDSGMRGEYDPGLRVVHPDKRLTAEAAARAWSYGRGCGFVLGKQRFGWRVVAALLVRPLGGLVLGVLRGRFIEMRYYSATFSGRLAGLRAGIRSAHNRAVGT